MTAFDRYAYLTTVNSIEEKLRELKYIDDALTYLEEVRVNNVPDGGRGTWLKTQKIELGWTVSANGYAVLDTNPFGGDHRITEDMITDELAAILESVTTYAQIRMSQFKDGVAKITDPDAETIRSAADTLNEIQASIENDNAIQTGTTAWGLSTDRWEGEGAEAFRRYFVQPFAQIVDNHRLAAAQASAVMFATLELVNGHQTTVMNFVEAIDEMLQDQLDQRAAGADGASVKEFLGVFSSLFGLLGTIATATGAGAPIGTAISIITGGLGIVAGALPEGESESIQASRATEVATLINNMWFDQSRLYKEGLSEISTASWNAHILTYEDEQDGLLFPRAPTLGDASPKDFHHGSSGQY